MNQPQQFEKATELVQVRVTPSQKEELRKASNGNISEFFRTAANEKISRVMTRKVLTGRMVA